jgi:hypothetical protein
LRGDKDIEIVRERTLNLTISISRFAFSGAFSLVRVNVANAVFVKSHRRDLFRARALQRLDWGSGVGRGTREGRPRLGFCGCGGRGTLVVFDLDMAKFLLSLVCFRGGRTVGIRGRLVVIFIVTNQAGGLVGFNRVGTKVGVVEV